MGWTDERTNGRTGKRTNERKTVVAKANCETLCKLFNRNANSTYCMIYGQPRRFSDLVPRQAVAKCTFVMYIIKLIVQFFSLCTICIVWVCVNVCLCRCPYLCQFFWVSNNFFFALSLISFRFISSTQFSAIFGQYVQFEHLTCIVHGFAWPYQAMPGHRIHCMELNTKKKKQRMHL